MLCDKSERNENAKSNRFYISHMHFSVAELVKMFLINTPFLQKSELIAKEKSIESLFCMHVLDTMSFKICQNLACC